MGGRLHIVIAYFLTCSIAELSISREVTDCYANELMPYKKFGTKTAYEFVYPRSSYGSKYGDSQVQNCEAVQIWLISRHGTRYPSRKEIKNMHMLRDLKVQIIRNHEERKNGRLCQPDLENLRTWNLNISMADSNLLTPQGKDDMRLLARRIKNKYPVLFSQGYSQNLFEFRHTKNERTRQSAQAFAEGLFGADSGVYIPHATENDPLLYPYGNCSYWIRHVENNTETSKERVLFLQSMEMTTLIHNVSQRLGFLYELPVETVLLMYDMCRFNKAWAPDDRSPWCAAFSNAELQVLEYLDDLETYYDSGYGNELNLKIGCSPIKDMLQRFELLQDDSIDRMYQPSGVFYFTHRKAIVMTLSRLGVKNRGPPPKHYDYYYQSHREWRISDITPFAGNLAAVFFKCATGEYDRVMFFLNEKKIDYEGCEDGLCSWSYIRGKFMDVLQHCDLNWCHNASSKTKPLVFVIFIIFNVIRVMVI